MGLGTVRIGHVPIFGAWQAWWCIHGSESIRAYIHIHILWYRGAIRVDILIGEIRSARAVNNGYGNIDSSKRLSRNDCKNLDMWLAVKFWFIPWFRKILICSWLESMNYFYMCNFARAICNCNFFHCFYTVFLLVE